MKAYCERENLNFRLGLVTPVQFEYWKDCIRTLLRLYMTGTVQIMFTREKLANLSGKKYHGKKNHVNKFQKTYPDWKYESISDENVEDCFQIALKWRNANDVDEDDEKNAEMTVAMNSLRLYKELGLRGGLLRVNQEVVAFTMGEPVCDDTIVVHIEGPARISKGLIP
ncbi:MAG: phosphatidylglycerol lysyltransferase domain-containing protein [Lachnospiraceae bacterium]